MNHEAADSGRGPTPPTKTETYALIAKRTGLTRKQVAEVFDSLYDLAKEHLDPEQGMGVFAIPGLAKIRVVEKSATRPRRGVNPFTGEHITIPGKPSRAVVKLQPLKPLRDIV